MAAERAGTTHTPAVLPPQVTMGLLDYITAHSLDQDYAPVSERTASERDPRQPGTGLAALVILGLFGLLVATAAVQTSRNAVQEADGHDQLATQITARRTQVDSRRQRVTELREEVDTLQTQYLQASTQGRQLSTRLSRLEVRTGAAAVTGPGVRVVVGDNPQATDSLQRVLDKDLQKLANALWASGAEAISINGQRLSNLSAIRHAGSAITVNGRSLEAPYTVLAIGNPDAIPARFADTEHGLEWFNLKAAYGLQFDMTPEESLKVPAARDLDLRHARTLEERP
ncbi:MAG TPA: DUF881 domain-containing protein [Nocardioidaceae bacterium]|nr:DUF881 domain-containing protein [Nocardioidaceae bacterium]